MKNARMNSPHFRFILFPLKVFGEVVTYLVNSSSKLVENRTSLKNLTWLQIESLVTNLDAFSVNNLVTMETR